MLGMHDECLILPLVPNRGMCVKPATACANRLFCGHLSFPVPPSPSDPLTAVHFFTQFLLELTLICTAPLHRRPSLCMPAADNDRWTMFCEQHVRHASAKHAAPAQGAVDKVSSPKDLFQALFHHFLCLADTSLRVVPASGGPPQGKRGLSGTSANLAKVTEDTEGERILCVRAMAAVYTKHAAAIGTQHNLIYHCMLLLSYYRSDLMGTSRYVICSHALFICKRKPL